MRSSLDIQILQQRLKRILWSQKKNKKVEVQLEVLTHKYSPDEINIIYEKYDDITYLPALVTAKFLKETATEEEVLAHSSN